ncbi:hypothetical protein [Streptomyces yaizuensis]|uniref:Lipoprotein n=1 Tax=Streptomyces yaizuensis TaxID=2989713 RepID=A0ABQ5P6J0_9ACTN|nr:hypothetical protein [Streptomyces sp. YSPA8]GLF98200.1 hypothetical protein SYYSPA8_27905 [Streptomyces sp. YSPA8]
MNIPSASRIALTGATTAAAALVLTACTGSGSIEHGTVKEKRGHAAYTVPETNCRTVTSSSFTQSLTLKGGPGGGRGGSGSRGSSGGSGKTQKDKSTDTGSGGAGTPQKGPDTTTRRVCDPARHHPARWELKLQDGKHTGWKRVSKEIWDEVNVGDRI